MMTFGISTNLIPPLFPKSGRMDGERCLPTAAVNCSKNCLRWRLKPKAMIQCSVYIPTLTLALESQP